MSSGVAIIFQPLVSFFIELSCEKGKHHCKLLPFWRSNFFEAIPNPKWATNFHTGKQVEENADHPLRNQKNKNKNTYPKHKPEEPADPEPQSTPKLDFLTISLFFMALCILWCFDS